MFCIIAYVIVSKVSFHMLDYFKIIISHATILALNVKLFTSNYIRVNIYIELLLYFLFGQVFAKPRWRWLFEGIINKIPWIYNIALRDKTERLTNESRLYITLCYYSVTSPHTEDIVVKQFYIWVFVVTSSSVSIIVIQQMCYDSFIET